MRTILIGVALVAGLYCLALIVLYARQRQMVFVPNVTRPDLARAGVPGVREIAVPTPDGLTLLAWYLPPPVPLGRVVLFLHGNTGHIGHVADRLGPFHALGWGVLLLEYRGYGGNPGAPSEAGLRIDAQAGLAALRGLGFPPDRILVWGQSLGTGPVVQLAAGTKVAAVLLESPYTSMVDIARQRFPWVPVDLLLRDRFDTLAVIGQVTAPVLVMHGALDRTVPVEMGRAVFAAAGPGKALWIAPDAGHVDLAEAGAIAEAGDFVRRLDQSRFVSTSDANGPDY